VSIVERPRRAGSIPTGETPAGDDTQTVACSEGTAGAHDLTIEDLGPGGSPSAPSLSPGTRVGRYEILGELGRGGMGVVYRAHDSALDREVALKCLHRRGLDREALARLAREAQALARLSHPNVVIVYDVSSAGDELLVAMEYVRGTTLREWLQSPRPWPAVIDVFGGAGRGLAAAHAQGMVHRDFKPANVMMGRDGRVRVLDFGLVVLGEVPSTVEAGSASGELEADAPTDLTATGTVMGTPAYMAPEQHTRRSVDARSDQFAFCVTLWEGLVGKRPYDGSYADILAAKHRGPPAWPEGSAVPRRIVAAVRRGLAPDPAERWPTMDALLLALAAPRRRWRWGLVPVAGLAALGGAIAWSMAAPEPCAHQDDALAGVWDQARAERAEHALRASGVVHGQSAWPTIQRTLDDHAAAWHTERTAACRAALDEHDEPATLVDLRMACLERDRRALQVAVDGLLAVERDDVDAVLMEVADLPSPHRCAEVVAPAAGPPLPDDPAVARQVEEIREDLARAHTWIEARSYAAVESAVERLTGEAEATGYAPVRLDVELLAGRLELSRHELDAGVDRLTKVFDQASALGHDRAAVEAAARLAVGEGQLRGRPREGRIWGESAVAMAARVGADTESEALARDSFGRVLLVGGESSAAIDAHARALAIRERVLGPERLVTVMTRHRLGYALVVAGRAEEGLARLTEVQQQLEQMLGPEHPEIATVSMTRAMALADRGRYEEAEASYLRALEIRELTLAAGDPLVAEVLLVLGNLYVQRGEPARALPLHERALAIREQAYGSDDHRVAATLSNVATVHGLLGQLDQAERMHRRALDLRRATLGPDHPAIATSLNNLALVLIDQQRWDAADELLREALDLYERRAGAEVLELASPLTNQGRVRRGQGRAAEAEALLRRALGLRLAAHGAQSLEVAEVQHVLALALADQGRHDEAVALLTTVVPTVERAVGPAHPSLGEPLRALGLELRALGRNDEAEAVLGRARSIEDPLERGSGKAR
jgi:eukaryotic-like serine/threonine-protein kinase